jgi:rhodanese-related sulfurtransferase
LNQAKWDLRMLCLWNSLSYPFEQPGILSPRLWASNPPLLPCGGLASSPDAVRRNPGIQGLNFPYFVALHSGYLATIACKLIVKRVSFSKTASIFLVKPLNVMIFRYLSTILICLFTTSCQYMQPDYLTILSPAELNTAMAKQDIFLVDVHTPEQQHIKGTDAFIPYDEIDKHVTKLPQDKSTPIYLYCAGGPMGNAAARTLYDLGFQHLYNLDGGAAAWRRAGLAFE